MCEDYVLEDLQYKGLKIFQPKQGYRFTSDAVLLANFVKNAAGKKVAELGTGSGVVALLVAKKLNPAQVVAVDILPEMCFLAQRSVSLNGLEDKIKVVCADAKGCFTHIGAGFDIVVVNPPYERADSGGRRNSQMTDICRREVLLTLEDVFAEGAKLLKNGGSLYIVHKPERLADACALGRQKGVEAKELCLVSSKADAAPNLFLMRCVKGGKMGLRILPPLILFDNDGLPTQRLKNLYGESFACREQKKEQTQRDKNGEL